MKKVTAVGKYGNVVVDEKDNTNNSKIMHDKMIYSMFEEVLEPLKNEKVEGDLINIWPNAGLITKYLEMMVYLETINDEEVINHPVCIIPENVSESQLNYYEENYLHSLDTFITLNYDGDIFKLVRQDYLDSSELYDFLKTKVNTKVK